VKTEIGPVDLQAVRIVPGFGVRPVPRTRDGYPINDGRTWWARHHGKVVLRGRADAAGLYWVTLSRIQLRKMSTVDGEQRQRPPRPSGKSAEGVQKPQTTTPKEVLRRFSPEFSRPANFGWSGKFDEPLGSAQPNSCIERGSQPSSEELPTNSEDGEASGLTQAKASRLAGVDTLCLTRQQASDLLAARVRWGHRSFRKCAHILGIPAPEKAPFFEACVEAKASRYPRRPRGPHAGTVREPAPRSWYRLFFQGGHIASVVGVVRQPF
jgi:hypothetical protein